ncbi:zinc-ribbon domain-containing protein [Peribacillus frigoritolerans]|uniref:zinc-ribbon domain-containing protein n=1 Tax=Peribacillus frigoritolerans TaxID=450367 RepID=UPI00399D4CAF
MAKEWHPTQNHRLAPDHVTKCSHKSAWWKCEKGHEWDILDRRWDARIEQDRR